MTKSYSRSGTDQVLPSEVGTIAREIREARHRHGLTQAQLAGLSGTGLRFISELERGKPNVALNKVLAVLAVLGLHVRVTEEAT
jgi:HTH-type transcriptional regulator/antitoxin HipB